MERRVFGDSILKKIEYQEFNKAIKISSFFLIAMILFIYFGQFFIKNIFITFFDILLSVLFMVSIFISIVKSIKLIKIINLERKNDLKITKPKKMTGILFLVILFFIGSGIMFLPTSYKVSAHVLSVFCVSISLFSFYLVLKKI